MVFAVGNEVEINGCTDIFACNYDTDATDDDVKSASKNIMMQLRKSVSLRGNFPVEVQEYILHDNMQEHYSEHQNFLNIWD